jgi:hypothetical protein
MDATIKAGLRDKLTAGQIAGKLRTTKNAVIGRAHRLRGYVKPYKRRRFG